MAREAKAAPIFLRRFLSLEKAKENASFQPLQEKLLKGTQNRVEN